MADDQRSRQRCQHINQGLAAFAKATASRRLLYDTQAGAVGKRPEDRGYLQARLMRSETELKLSQYKIQ
jgi:hypothetical protein